MSTPTGSAEALSERECYCCGRDLRPGDDVVRLVVQAFVSRAVVDREYPMHRGCVSTCRAHREHRIRDGALGVTP